VSPKIRAAAAAAGRPEPRIVAGLPVAVHDDVAEARAAQAQAAALYASRPNFRAVVEMGGSSSPADTAIVGDERSVTQQLQALLDAGATEIHAAIFPVGPDPKASIRRTRSLLASLLG
jgi:alkanesulfonate monooxygenase SsuD/methylene tetrahydromethanopterin reductase-like flavin-dependent oxidoreductase (luciferase family)